MQPQNTQTKPATHQERIAYHLLERGSFTEREGVIELNITSGRNYINEFEKLIGLRLQRDDEVNTTNTGIHYRYRVADKQQAEALIKFINGKRTARNATLISVNEQTTLLAKFEETK